MAVRDLVVTLVGRDETSGAFNSAERSASSFSKVGATVAKAFGGVALAGIGAFTAGLAGGFQEAISYQRITDQLGQTLASTGNAAGTSLSALKEYAGQLESISGVDEELILSSQNVLATFTRIQNKVGEGNDVFNQASLAALNMSTTLGTDVSGAAVQVGKALNDPLKGITALSKAGVSFTAEQKESIKAMVASGDTMGAQKVILAELTTQFGGAAEAAGKGLGGDMARLKDTVSDTFRTIATAALPTLSRLATTLGDNLPGIITTVSGAFGRLGGVIREAASFFTGSILPGLRLVGGYLADTFRPAVEAVVSAAQGLVQRFRDVGPELQRFGQFVAVAAAAVGLIATQIAGVLLPALTTLFSAGLGVVLGAFAQMVTVVDSNRTTFTVIAGLIVATVVPALASMAIAAVTSAATTVAAWVTVNTAIVVAAVAARVNSAIMIAQWVASAVAATAGGAAIAAAWLVAIGPIALVIAAVIAVVVAIVKNWDDIKAATQAAWSAVTGFVSEAWEKIKAAVTIAVNAVKTVITTVFDAVKTYVTTVLGVYKTIIVGGWEAIKTAVSTAVNAVKTVITTVFDAVKSFLSNVVDGYKVIFTTAWNAIKTVVTGAAEGIKTAVTAAFNAVKTTITGVMDGIKGIIGRAWDTIVSGVTGLGGRISGAAKGVFDGIKNAFKDAINFIIRGWNSLSFDIPSIDLDWNGPLPGGKVKVGGFGIGVPQIPQLAEGGIVPARPGGTLANIGEGGRDEAVIPLDSGMRSLGMRDDAKTDRLIEILMEQNDLLRRIPRDMVLTSRSSAGSRSD